MWLEEARCVTHISWPRTHCLACLLRRKDSDKLQQLLESSSARLVVLHRHSGLLRPLETASTGGHGPKWEPALLPASAVPESCRDTRVGTIFLGLDDDGSGVFAVSLTEEGAQDVANEHAGQQVALGDQHCLRVTSIHIYRALLC